MANHDIDTDKTAAPAPSPGHREVVGVFHDEQALEAAIDDLLEHGFDRADVSLLASEKAVVEKLGHAYEKVSDLEDDVSAARVAYVAKEDYGAAEGGLISGLVYVGALAGAGAVVASGGALMAVLVAAAVSGGAGGAVGLGIARWIERQRVRRLQEQIEKGGLLIWVHAGSEAQEARATEVLKQHGAEDVHAHELSHEVDVAPARVAYPPLLSLIESITPHRPRGV